MPKGDWTPGRVVDTVGYPLDSHTYGGGLSNGMGETESGKNLV